MDGGSILIESTMWGAIWTWPKCEVRVERALEAIGYEPLVIRYNKLIRGHKHKLNGQRVRSRQDNLEPRIAIPGYIFLPLISGDNADGVDDIDGVKRVFRHRDAYGYPARPIIVRARFVEQCKEAAHLLDETPGENKPIRTDLKPGDRVRSPAGVVGYLLSLDDKGRAKYMAEVLGRQVPTEIEDARQLERVEA